MDEGEDAAVRECLNYSTLRDQTPKEQIENERSSRIRSQRSLPKQFKLSRKEHEAHGHPHSGFQKTVTMVQFSYTIQCTELVSRINMNLHFVRVRIT